MNSSLLIQVLGPVLIELLAPLIGGAVTIIVGYALVWWRKLTGYEMKEADRARLNEATERAVRFAAQKLIERRGNGALGLLGPQDRSLMLADASDYMRTFNPGDLARFGLSDPGLLEMRLTPMLPLPGDAQQG